MNLKRRIAPVGMPSTLPVLAALSLLGLARDAAAWTPLDPSIPRWTELPVGYYVNGSTAPSTLSGTPIARIDSGFASWTNAPCTEWQTQNLGDTTGTYEYNDGKNIIHWISSSWPSELGDINSVIGVTMPVWGMANIILDADMVFNNVGFCWDNSGSGDCVDAQSIATHEEGHFLGLGHSNVSTATMVVFYGGGSSLRTLDDDDVEGVCALYPIGGTSVTSTGTGATECQSCFNGSSSGTCAPAFSTCSGSETCRSFAVCIQRCDDDACFQDCIDANREGAQTYIDMIECMCTDCTTECFDECGGKGGAGGAGASTTSSTTSSSSAADVGGGADGAGGAGGADRPESHDGAGEVSSCSCDLGGRSAGTGGVFLLAAAFGLASRRRRRGSARG